MQVCKIAKIPFVIRFTTSSGLLPGLIERHVPVNLVKSTLRGM